MEYGVRTNELNEPGSQATSRFARNSSISLRFLPPLKFLVPVLRSSTGNPLVFRFVRDWSKVDLATALRWVLSQLISTLPDQKCTATRSSFAKRREVGNKTTEDCRGEAEMDR